MLKKHILFLGCTGAGKSTTVNKILNMNSAKVGKGVDPQTKKILGYALFPLVLWDTPGLGESPEADKIYIDEINNLINGSIYEFSKIVIVCESGKRDLDSIYRLINEVVKKNKLEERVILALNQCELAMKKNNWNHDDGLPNNDLSNFLTKQVNIFESRIKESTGITIKESVFYSAMLEFNLFRLKNMIIKS